MNKNSVPNFCTFCGTHNQSNFVHWLVYHGRPHYKLEDAIDIENALNAGDYACMEVIVSRYKKKAKKRQSKRVQMAFGDKDEVRLDNRRRRK